MWKDIEKNFRVKIFHPTQVQFLVQPLYTGHADSTDFLPMVLSPQDHSAGPFTPLNSPMTSSYLLF